MGVFDKASLALVPDGIKDGKLYSIKPTDGSGDFTFSRGSNLAATRVNENGLIEKGRENLVEFSNNFSTSKTPFGVTVSSGEAGYDGTNNAWKLIKSSSSGDYLRWTESGSLGAAVFTYSIYVKAGSLSYFVIWTTGGNQAYFELTGNGSVTYTQGSDLVDSKIESVGNGWYRCSLTASFNNSEVRFYPTTDGTPGVAGGTSGDFVYIQNFQAEYGLVATEYVDRVGYDAAYAGVLEDLPRIDYTGGTPSLLLEPSRTNLITNGEYINVIDWSVGNVTLENNSITSPENQTNATKVTGTGGFSQRRIFESFSQVSGLDFTISIFAKEDTENLLFLRFYNTTDNVYANASFNLSTGAIASNSLGTAKIENYGNGWYRCILTGTPSTTTTTGGAYFNLTSDGNSTSTTSLYLWGAQLEQASYPTSYIPTYGATATRGGDNINADIGIAQVGSNLSSGTWFIDFMKTGQDGNNQALILTPLNNNDQQIRFHFDPNTNVRFRDAVHGYTTMGGSVSNTTSRTKILVSVDSSAGIAKVFANGAQVGSNYTLGATPFQFSRILGYGNNFKLFSTIFFPEALSDAECIALTT